MEIVGRGYCEWTIKTPLGVDRTLVGEEFYLKEKKYLVGGDKGMY